MQRAEAYARFLTGLEDSPMFSWGKRLSLWATMAEDPYVITPVIIHPGLNLVVLEQLARTWPTEATTRVPGLLVIAEHMEIHERTVVAAHRDGEVVVVQKRSGQEPVVIDDAFASASDLVDGARLVGAAAWR